MSKKCPSDLQGRTSKNSSVLKMSEEGFGVRCSPCNVPAFDSGLVWVSMRKGCVCGRPGGLVLTSGICKGIKSSSKRHSAVGKHRPEQSSRDGVFSRRGGGTNAKNVGGQVD